MDPSDRRLQLAGSVTAAIYTLIAALTHLLYAFMVFLSLAGDDHHRDPPGRGLSLVPIVSLLCFVATVTNFRSLKVTLDLQGLALALSFVVLIILEPMKTKDDPLFLAMIMGPLVAGLGLNIMLLRQSRSSPTHLG